MQNGYDFCSAMPCHLDPKNAPEITNAEPFTMPKNHWPGTKLYNTMKK
jgi:hypothetical protein